MCLIDLNACTSVCPTHKRVSVLPLVSRKLSENADFIVLLLRIWALNCLKDKQQKVKDRSGCLANMEKRPPRASKGAFI